MSRMENGCAVPKLVTLEKIARALKIPLYYIFYDGKKKMTRPKRQKREIRDWACQGTSLRQFTRFKHALARLSERDRALLLFTASEIASSSRGKKS